MKIFLRFIIVSCIVSGFFILIWNLFEIKSFSQEKLSGKAFAEREKAYRFNNIGVALLDQYKHAEAVESFRDSLNSDPDLKSAQINLAIALFYLPDLDAALKQAQKAREISPERPQPVYILGLIAKTQNRTDDAINEFRRALEFDPRDVGARVNLAQIYIQQQKYKEAVAELRPALEAEPYNTTTIYNLATALLRIGEREEGQLLMKRFQELRQSGAGTAIGQNYLQQGRFAEALTSTGAETELVEKTAPAVVFQTEDIGLEISQKKKTSSMIMPDTPVSIAARSGAALFDFDGDGDLDLAEFAKDSTAFYLFRNDAGKFVDVSKAAGDLSKPLDTPAAGIAAGDYDGDALTDLLIFGSGQPRLFRNTGGGKFQNVSADAKISASEIFSISGAFADADHDGDLDILLGGFARAGMEKSVELPPNQLLRNNGNGTFTDISAAAKIDAPSRAVAVVPTDFDNRRDVDFLILNYTAAPQLWQNLRDGSFRNVAKEVGLERKDNWTSAAVGDFNKDTFSDFFFGRQGGAGVFAVSDGRGKFTLKDAPAGTENASAAQFLDYDNDGLLDLVAQTDAGFVLTRNLGSDWTKADSSAFRIKPDAKLKGARQMISGDIDGDGDIDLLTFAENGGLHFLKNTGGERNNSEIVRLTGRVSNKTGVGAKIDMRSGSLAQKLESYAASPAPAPADIHFGLGQRDKPDAVRVIWTSGIIQAEVDFPAPPKGENAAAIKIEELDRKPSSCPYLYAWNGEKFEFISDFLGGGEMAYSFGGGRTNMPDGDEYVRIPANSLKPKDGKYELRVTNELEEVLYLDRFELTAVDHPENTEIYPNEGAGIPTAGKFLLYATAAEHAPLEAFDGKGRDVLEKVKETDRNFYDTFESEKIRGYAKPHELILTLDNRSGFNGRTLLLLTGWTDYAFSSDNVAAAQSGLSLNPPKLQVRNGRGEWETVIESIGFSVGRPQTVVVDLTGKFLSKSREVRILSNMKTLWDKIAVDTSENAAQNPTVSKLDAQSAELRERGFSLEVKPDGKEPVLVDYERVLSDGRWKYFSGDFTRTGDVLPLLERADDVFIISKTGDELALSFSERQFPALKKGMKRTFLLYAVGYSKEMDINSASPEIVHPLPFGAMKRYPYGADERFPMTPQMQKIYDEYTTRSVRTVFPRIEAALIK